MDRRILKSICIPPDFTKNLPLIYEQTFQWTVDILLHPDCPPRGSITHYAVNDKAYGNIILAPGLASNTKIEPIMQSISYWSLTHRYNVYALNSFLGEFLENPTPADAQRNTYQEFINLMDTGIDIVEKHCAGTWTCLIGHSIGSTGAVEIFNRRVLSGKKPRVSAAILFAPLLFPAHSERQKDVYRRFRHIQDMSEEKFQETPMQILSPHDFPNAPTTRYVPIMPQFLDDACGRPLRPDLMNKWGIPVTIVAGGQDRRVAISELRAAYDQVAQMPNGHLFKFVEFPNSKHSFIDQHKHFDDVLKIIKSQRPSKQSHQR